MACGRLVGSRLVVELGEDRLLVGGAPLAAVGMLTAASSGSVTVALAGFVLVGLGLANVFPVAIAGAGALGGAGGAVRPPALGPSRGAGRGHLDQISAGAGRSGAVTGARRAMEDLRILAVS
jgi:hypothetical protein